MDAKKPSRGFLFLAAQGGRIPPHACLAAVKILSIKGGSEHSVMAQSLLPLHIGTLIAEGERESS